MQVQYSLYKLYSIQLIQSLVTHYGSLNHTEKSKPHVISFSITALVIRTKKNGILN